MKMYKYLQIMLILVAVAIWASFGCSGDRPTSSDDESQTQISVNLEKTSLAERVDLINLTVIQNDSIFLEQSTTVVNGQFTFQNVVLPTGLYLFQLEGIDSDGNDGLPLVTYSGSSNVNIGAGTNNVTIDLTPAVPMVRMAPYYLATVESSVFLSRLEFWNIPEFRSGVFTIQFDPDLIQFVAASESNTSWGSLDIAVEDEIGQLSVTIDRISVSDVVPATHEIVDFTFIALANGQAIIDPIILEMVDDEGEIPGLLSVVQESQELSITEGGTGEFGVVGGFVFDAITEDPLIGAAVSLVGPTTLQTNSMEDGLYIFTNVPFGTYQLSANVSGYVSFGRTIEVDTFVVYEELPMLSILLPGQYRVRLTWGAIPADLDAHTWTLINDFEYEIYYNNPGSPTFEPFIALDDDDQTGYGPEVTTIYQISSDCIFAVHNFSAYVDLDPTPLTNSNALVEVYSSVGKIGEYSVPTTGTGLWWYVFDLTPSGQLIPRNTISDLPPRNSGVSKRTTVAKTK